VNWVAAVDKGAIAPQAGLTPEAKSKDVMDLDVELVPEAGEMFKAVFPHKTHTAVLGCENCHPGIFQMAKGTAPITMAKINAGEYCGVCHGKVAFGADACGRCHPAMAGGQ
jgi:c(7)-type cytochrome triheme protein